MPLIGGHCFFILGLKLLAEVLRVGAEPAVCIAFIKPGAAPHLGGLFSPVHSPSKPLIEMHVVAPAVGAQHHALGVRLD